MNYNEYSQYGHKADMGHHDPHGSAGYRAHDGDMNQLLMQMRHSDPSSGLDQHQHHMGQQHGHHPPSEPYDHHHDPAPAVPELPPAAAAGEAGRLGLARTELQGRPLQVVGVGRDGGRRPQGLDQSQPRQAGSVQLPRQGFAPVLPDEDQQAQRPSVSQQRMPRLRLQAGQAGHEHEQVEDHNVHLDSPAEGAGDLTPGSRKIWSAALPRDGRLDRRRFSTGGESTPPRSARSVVDGRPRKTISKRSVDSPRDDTKSTSS
ncbi:hypothetical protein THAOC_14751 [Thalassiosira oceanica]|uniref:Uncharacterized protein n=1 Tax=Thalassiosira oceanica TaxID=159749 RepID=K0T204_THAOC|nr:hypothetical protein THAOC_14751 [Thalassiosira oceanica]|eukprot:EJK64507.1 hypothetical protein THAOC_14751 [Thalassiosira oceanica]